MATRPESFPQMNQPEPVEHSLTRGSLPSDLYKKETMIPKGKEWARELLMALPQSLLPIATQFIMESKPDEAQERAQMLLEAIHELPGGTILGAKNQLQLLGFAMDRVKEQLGGDQEQVH